MALELKRSETGVVVALYLGDNNDLRWHLDFSSAHEEPMVENLHSSARR